MDRTQGIAMTGMNTRSAYDLDLRHVRGQLTPTPHHQHSSTHNPQKEEIR